MIRIDLVETGGRLITVRRLVPHVSLGKNSLPVPSPRSGRGPQVEYHYTEVGARHRGGRIEFYSWRME